MKPWLLDSDVYPVNMYLFPPCSREVARKYIEDNYNVAANGYCRYNGCCFSLTNLKTNQKVFFLWVDRFKLHDSVSVSNLIHEISHLVHSVFQYLNVPGFIEENNEPFAYFLGSLVEQCLRLLTKGKRG